MKQTRLISFIEAVANVIIGYCVALCSQLIIFPFVGINVSLNTNFIIGFWFTLVSLIRSYIIRRWFETRLHVIALRITRKRNI